MRGSATCLIFLPCLCEQQRVGQSDDDEEAYVAVASLVEQGVVTLKRMLMK